jgi:hypothetical protein
MKRKREFLLGAFLAAAGCSPSPTSPPSEPPPKKGDEKKPSVDPKDLLPREVTDEKFIKARSMVIALSAAVKQYRAQYKVYPEALDALVTPPDGGKPLLLDAEALKDPWGRPYLYDPAGPKNNGKQPDIWSLGPGPGKPDGVIGNW